MNRPLSPLASPEERRRSGLAMLTIVLAGVAAYANSLHGPFVFDDLPSILENPTIRDLHDWRAVLLPTESNVSAGGRPVLNLSLALNYAVSGISPWSYHALNALIHLAAALTLFGWLRRLLRLPGLGERFGRHATWLALGIAVGWVGHPLQTEAVTYTVQRAESLMGLFFLLMAYAFTRGVESDSRGWLVLSVMSFALSLATKEVAVVAPVLIWLFDRTFFSGTFRAAWERRRAYYVALGLLWLGVVVLFLQAGGNRAGQKGFGIGVSFWSYGLTQFEAVAHYLRLSFWPFPLVFDYGTTWAGPPWRVLWCALIVLTLLGISLVAVIRRRPLGLAGAWFFCVFAPTSLTPGPSQMLAEQRMYLPLAAVLATVVLGLYAWRPRAAFIGCGVAALVGLVLTIGRNADYRSAIALWSDTIKRVPENGRAHGNLAQALVEAGRNEEAMLHYTEAARLLPDEPRFPYNYAVLKVAAGQAAEAIEPYRAALRLMPADPKVQNNLAVAYAAIGDFRRATVHATVAVHLRPDDPELHYNRAYYLLGLHRAADAIAEYETALRLNPHYAAAHTNLGNTLLQLGRITEAAAHYEVALRLTPNSAEVQGNLAVAWLRLGRVSEAHRAFAAVLSLAPENSALAFRLGRIALQQAQPIEAIPLLASSAQALPSAVEPRLYLAEARYKSGDVAGAIADYERVIKLDPRNEVARTNLTTLRARVPK